MKAGATDARVLGGQNRNVCAVSERDGQAWLGLRLPRPLQRQQLDAAQQPACHVAYNPASVISLLHSHFTSRTSFSLPRGSLFRRKQNKKTKSPSTLKIQSK